MSEDSKTKLNLMDPEKEGKAPLGTKKQRQTIRNSPRNTCIWSISSFLISFAVSVNYALLALELNWFIAIPVTFAFAVIICLLVTFSKKWRAILVICVPEAFSKSGLIIASTILYLLAATGPINNIGHNMGEVRGMITCNQELGRIQQAKFQEAITEANERAMAAVIASVESAVRAGKKVSDGFATASKIFTDAEKKVKDHLEGGLKNARNDCNKRLGPALDTCKHNVDRAYQDCRGKLGFSGRRKRNIFNNIGNKVKHHVVDPIQNIGSKIEDGIVKPVRVNVIDNIRNVGSDVLASACEVIKVGQICSVVKSADVCENVLGGMAKITKNFRFLDYLNDLKKLMTISISYDHKAEKNATVVKDNLTGILDGVQEEVRQYVEKAGLIHWIFKMLLPLTLILLVVKAFKFNKAYLKSLNSITKVKIPEIKLGTKLAKTMVAILIPLLTFGPILVFEFALAQVLHFAQYTNATFSVSGKLDFRAQVEGGAILKPIMTQFFEEAGLGSEYRLEVSNQNCLPDPVDSSSLFAVLTFAVIILVMGGLSFAGQYLLAYRSRILKWVYE